MRMRIASHSYLQRLSLPAGDHDEVASATNGI